MTSSAFAGLAVDRQSLAVRVSLCIIPVVVSCCLYMGMLLLRVVLWVLLYCVSWMRRMFLSDFGKLRKATTGFVMSVRLSLRMGQFGVQWMDFHEIWNFSIFQTSVKKIPVSLKSYKNNGYFTWRPIHIFDHISFNSP